MVERKYRLHQPLGNKVYCSSAYNYHFRVMVLGGGRRTERWYMVDIEEFEDWASAPRYLINEVRDHLLRAKIPPVHIEWGVDGGLQNSLALAGKTPGRAIHHPYPSPSPTSPAIISTHGP
jgi:hypothetical protein